MPRIVSPPLDELANLRTPLNEGERIVLDFFLANLSEDWEIYIQPHLNGLRPDFVLLNPKVGIAVYEVKHWDLDAMRYRVETTSRGLELWATNKQGKDFRVSDNPIDKIKHYKKRINNLYVPSIGQKYDEGQKDYFALVTAGVIFTKETTARVKDLLSPLVKNEPIEKEIDEVKELLTPSSSNESTREQPNKISNLPSLLSNNNSSREYIPIIGIDKLEDKEIEIVLPASKWRTSKYMNEEIAKQLRGWLVEPDFAQVQRQPLELNAKQKALSTTRTKSGYRRIRGAAGSGKSLVLAARAANLSAEGKNVLSVSFNITLWHYLRDLVVRHKVPGAKVNKITYMHFHEWCKDIIIEGGLELEYKQLFGDKLEKEELTKILENDIVALADSAIDNIERNIEYGQIEREKFDAILVDEGQDFNLIWWNTLRRLLKPEGEMILVADETQDLYDRVKEWTSQGMNDAGFQGGPWNQLDVCYRTPNQLIDYLKVFVEKYLPESNIRLINAEAGMLNLWPANLSWVQVSSEELLPLVCAEATLKMPEINTTDIVAYPDLILLMPNHSMGLKSVAIIEANGFKVLHIFSQIKKEQKPRKMNFFMGAANIKACTIHSFKGWEARYLVIAIDEKTDLSTVYVAMSRLKRHTQGSHLTVVCSNPKLRDFGTTWPSFEERSLTKLETPEELPF